MDTNYTFIDKSVKISIILLIMIIANSCGDSPEQTLKKKVAQAVRSNNELNKSEWDELSSFVKEKQESYPELVTGGEVDLAKLNSFVTGALPKVREGATPPTIYKPENLSTGSPQGGKSSIIAPANSDLANPTKIQVFLENSHSMDGYIKGTTEFEAAVSDLLVLLGSNYQKDNIYPNFINNRVYPLKENLREMTIEQLISTLEPNSATYRQGNQNESKLNSILGMVLKETTGNTISVLVSDFIYSLDNRKLDTEGALNFEKSLTKDAFLTKFKQGNTATVFIKLQSKFTGSYYDKNNKVISLNNEVRPYYVCFFGKPEQIDDLLSKIDVTKLQGYQSKYVLKPSQQTNDIFYTVLKVKNKLGSFEPSRENRNYVHAIEDATFEDGGFRFTIAVDFKNIGVDLAYLEDTANYKVTGDLVIEKIEKCSRTGFAPREQSDWRAATNCTHLITVRALRNFPSQTLTIELKDQIPKWIYQTNTDNDVAKNLVMNKTFGLKYLIQGISESYQEFSRSKGNGTELTHAKINISISK
ncbi:MAG: hypothetical protein MUF58_06870 [Arcicella sp.]|jgi:hypothetical protein|nr:hypothetical protein [Arcicella sp.]